MIFCVGTTSGNKIESLRKALAGFDIVAEVKGEKVSSGIAEQPMSVHETALGAVTRAKAAFGLLNLGIGVGLEGGLDPAWNGNSLDYVCVAAFYDGERCVVGVSSRLAIPAAVADVVIKQGLEAADLLREYRTEDAHEQRLIDMILSRDELFGEAIRNALLNMKTNSFGV